MFPLIVITIRRVLTCLLCLTHSIVTSAVRREAVSAYRLAQNGDGQYEQSIAMFDMGNRVLDCYLLAVSRGSLSGRVCH